MKLDESVDYDHDSDTYFESEQGKVKQEIDFDIANTKIYVNAYAVQADSLPDADEDGTVTVEDAYAAFLGQWGDGSGDGIPHAMLKPENFTASEEEEQPEVQQ